MRVMAVLRHYPQLSETYIETEIRHLARNHELRIVSQGRGDRPYEHHHPYTYVARSDVERLVGIAKEFDPHVIHTHYLHQAPVVDGLSELIG